MKLSRKNNKVFDNGEKGRMETVSKGNKTW